MWEIACLSQESRVSFESATAVREPVSSVVSETALLAFRPLASSLKTWMAAPNESSGAANRRAIAPALT